MNFYDVLETRSLVEREAALMAALAAQVAIAQSKSTAFAEILKDVNASKTAVANAELGNRRIAVRSAANKPSIYRNHCHKLVFWLNDIEAFLVKLLKN